MPKPARFSAAPAAEFRFVIGRIEGKEYWTNLAEAHLQGKLTNEELMKMTDAQLFLLAYHGDAVRTETYLRPRDHKVAEAQDAASNAGRPYVGAHRAVCILEFRRRLMATKQQVFAGRLNSAATNGELDGVVLEMRIDRDMPPATLAGLERQATACRAALMAKTP